MEQTAEHSIAGHGDSLYILILNCAHSVSHGRQQECIGHEPHQHYHHVSVVTGIEQTLYVHNKHI